MDIVNIVNLILTIIILILIVIISLFFKRIYSLMNAFQIKTSLKSLPTTGSIKYGAKTPGKSAVFLM
jgi:hypothetical protein